MNRGVGNLLVRWLVLALGVVLSTKIVPGISYDTGLTLAMVVLVLSFCNAILKPLLMLFTLPFIILTLGLGVWLINAALFYFVGHLVKGFQVDGFVPALLGALVVSVTNLTLVRVLRPSRPRPPRGAPKPVKPVDAIDI